MSSSPLAPAREVALQPDGHGVTDVASLHNAANTTSNFTPGFLAGASCGREFFQGISGSLLSDHGWASAGFPRPPRCGRLPDGDGGAGPRTLAAAWCERAWVDWLLPTVTGYYTLYLCTADQGALLPQPGMTSRQQSCRHRAQCEHPRNWSRHENAAMAASPENRTAPVFSSRRAGGPIYFAGAHERIPTATTAIAFPRASARARPRP